MSKIHLYLYQGIIDSLRINKCIQRYLSPDQYIPFYMIFFRVITKYGFDKNEQTKIMAYTTANIWLKAAKFMIILLILQWIRDISLSYFGQYLTNSVFWIIVGFIYLESALQMWVWQQEIGQEVVNIELQHYSNQAFAMYQINEEQEQLIFYSYNFIIIFFFLQSEPTLTSMERFFRKFLFNILFQLQTQLIAFIVNQLLWPFNYALRIPLFALFLSVNNTSTKIPFKEHLPYYINQNIPYLIGLNLIQSTLLHFATFPIFTGIQWIIQPIFILNSISLEPPRLYQNPDTKEQIIKRDTYEIHLKAYINEPEYKQKCENHLGYMTFPAILTPYIQKLLKKLLRSIEKKYGSDPEKIE